MTAIIQSTSGSASPGNPSGLTLSGVGAGHTLFLMGAWNSSGATVAAPTDSSGQTWTAAFQSGGANSVIGFYYLLNANAGTHTLTWSPGSGQYTAWTFGEFATSTGVDVTGTATAGSGTITTLTANSITTTNANDLVFGMIGVYDFSNANAGISDPPSGGWTSVAAKQSTISGAGYELCYQAPTSTGSFAPTWTFTSGGSSAAYVAQSISFKLTQPTTPSTVVQSAHGSSQHAAPSGVTLNGVVQGDTLFFLANTTSGSTPTLTDSSGQTWSVLFSQYYGTVVLNAYWLQNANGGVHSLTYAAATGTSTDWAFVETAPTLAADVIGSYSYGSGTITSLSANPITTTGTSDLVIAMFGACTNGGAGNSNMAISTPSGFTQLAAFNDSQATYNAGEFAYQITGPATIGATWTFGANQADAFYQSVLISVTFNTPVALVGSGRASAAGVASVTSLIYRNYPLLGDVSLWRRKINFLGADTPVTSILGTGVAMAIGTGSIVPTVFVGAAASRAIGSASLTTYVSLMGAGVALASGLGTLAAPSAALVGSAFVSAAGSAAMSVGQALAGSSVAGASGVAALTVTGVLVGSALAIGSGVGVFTVTAALASAATASASGAATFKAGGQALSGQALATASATAAFLPGGWAFAAAGAEANIGAASLRVAAALVGSATVSAAGSASLAVSSAFAAVGQALSAGVGALSVRAALAALGMASASGSASLVNRGLLTASAAATAQGALLFVPGGWAFVGAATALELGVAALTASVSLSGLAAASASGSATLNTRAALASSAVATAAGVAQLTVRAVLSGAAVSTQFGTAAISVNGLLYGVGAALAGGVGTLSNKDVLIGSGSAQASGGSSAFVSGVVLVGAGLASARSVSAGLSTGAGLAGSGVAMSAAGAVLVNMCVLFGSGHDNDGCNVSFNDKHGTFVQSANLFQLAGLG